MSKKDTVRKGTKRNGQVTMSDRLRAGMDKLVKAGWDLSTVSTAEIIDTSCKLIRGKNAEETAKLRKEFAPTAAQVSIVKREFTGGYGVGKVGRPSFETLGYTEEAVEEAPKPKRTRKPKAKPEAQPEAQPEQPAVEQQAAA